MILSDKTQLAIHLASKGLRVFPLRSSGTHNEMKRPAVPNWQKYASSDPETIERRWSQKFPLCNPGVATGQHPDGSGGLLVLDADVKDNKQGLESLEFMVLIGMIPASGYRVLTPTGGMHRYFWLPPGVRIASGVNCIPGFPDIDVRAQGGFVVGAGSTTPVGFYAASNDAMAKWGPVLGRC